MFKTLDPLLHTQLRLAIMTLLVSVERAEFNYILEKCNCSAGNLSVQLEKLAQAKYINIEKTYKNKKPLTLCRISDVGLKAFESYINDLKSNLNL